MRRVLLCGVAVLMCAAAVAQQPVPNGGFEEWTLVKGSAVFKDYEEPSMGWASGNGVIHVAAGADPVCEKSTDAHSGAFSAKLTTRSIFGQIASGSVFLGRFALNLANPVASAQRGIPFTGSLPRVFRGWMKYEPTASDSASIYAQLTRWDGSSRQLVASAAIIMKERVASWTPFEIAFNGTLTEQADTMIVVAASSAAGEFFRGSVGSTLWIDDVVFEYQPSSVNDDAGARTMIAASHTLVVPQHVTRVRATSLDGRSAVAQPLSADGRVDVHMWESGLWVVQGFDGQDRPCWNTCTLVVR